MAFAPSALQEGDIVLVAGGATSLPARLLDAGIRWSTGSRYTHAAIATGPGRLIEALWRVTEDDAGKYADVGDVFRVEGATPEQRAAAVAWARRRLGRTYSVTEILLDAARFDLHWQPRGPTLKHFTCSGLVAAAYAAGGVLLTRANWPSPGDLYNSPLLTEVS